MTDPYADIIHMPHHVSSARRKISILDRAAQFSPFAALTGHEAAIQETARLTDSQILLDIDSIAQLDAQIRFLADHISDAPQITADYFIPDQKKSGGSYNRITGTVKRINSQEQYIQLTDHRILFFHRITRLDSPLLADHLGPTP